MNINKYQIYDLIKTFISNNKKTIITTSLLVFLGGILGVYTIFNTTVEIDIESLKDLTLLNFMQEEISWITFLFYNLVDSIIFIILLTLPIFSVLFVPITLIMMFLKSYYYFLNLTILLKSLNFFGLFNTIIIILPSYLFAIISYLIFASLIISISFYLKNYKSFNNCYYNAKIIKKSLIIILLFQFVITFYEMIMLSLLCNKFIIG